MLFRSAITDTESILQQSTAVRKNLVGRGRAEDDQIDVVGRDTRGLQGATRRGHRQIDSGLALRGDVAALLRQGPTALSTLLVSGTAGLSTDAYREEVKRWIRTARHPQTGRPYTAMVYQPMLELLRFLRARGFRTWIVSGGEVEFMRAWSESVYGIPPEQVIGTRVELAYRDAPDGPILERQIGRAHV